MPVQSFPSCQYRVLWSPDISFSISLFTRRALLAFELACSMRRFGYRLRQRRSSRQ
uniref:Uncharacterized protein n=1 Tax=Anopheles quadriannulatus TaxID=34691 RepID=A0A182XRH0_ANOQN